MKRERLLVLLMIITMVSLRIIIGMYWTHGAKAQDFVRKVSGLPSEQKIWVLTADGDRIFVVDILLDPKRPVISSFPSPPYPFFQIDPVTEQVIREGKTNRVFARAILAEQEQTPYSWLAKDYEYWVIDDQNNIVFAARYGVDALTRAPTVSSVDAIDLSTREVKRTIRLQPEADYGAMALHPNGTKLYLSVREIEVGGLVWVYDTKTLERIKVIQLDCDHTIKDIHFSKDGQYLFGAVGSRGVAIIETRDDKIVGWINPPSDRLFKSPMALSSDEQEIYIGLEYGLKKGAVAAIDVAQKKIVRVLELSPTGCTSVVVIGDKLFAACLDGVYVIDIPAWRKKQ